MLNGVEWSELYDIENNLSYNMTWRAVKAQQEIKQEKPLI